VQLAYWNAAERFGRSNSCVCKRSPSALSGEQPAAGREGVLAGQPAAQPVELQRLAAIERQAEASREVADRVVRNGRKSFRDCLIPPGTDGDIRIGEAGSAPKRCWRGKR
jgi:hypothetical protein